MTIFDLMQSQELTEEEIAKVTGEGLEFKMIRKGTTLELYLGGNLVKELDLTVIG